MGSGVSALEATKPESVVDCPAYLPKSSSGPGLQRCGRQKGRGLAHASETRSVQGIPHSDRGPSKPLQQKVPLACNKPRTYTLGATGGGGEGGGGGGEGEGGLGGAGGGMSPEQRMMTTPFAQLKTLLFQSGQ